MADTIGKFRFRYGEVEAGLRAPHEMALESRFVLVTDSCSLHSCTNIFEGGYPRIHIAEFTGLPRVDAANVQVRSVFGNYSDGDYLYRTVDLKGLSLFSGFHVYLVVWNSGSLTWFIDNETVFEITDQMAIAHNFTRLQPSTYTGTGISRRLWPGPAEFEIDYIVVRQENPHAEPDLLFFADFTRMKMILQSFFKITSFMD
ncbi:hypothetical protein RvY_15311 [Ramazzottius varieornatus]|uniref:GH16 domain-containing protein n=1 Tax=Ramazzottius varieornatus TaxID=947166 RepID=A0A1D1VUD8_RAMVA|nr:hypothetical protein RvY_15311 [Ramazzottius varieornatus]